MSVAFDRSPQARQALEYHCPRWRELPALELYMDQMTGYIADVLRPLLDSEEEERPLRPGRQLPGLVFHPSC